MSEKKTMKGRTASKNAGELRDISANVLTSLTEPTFIGSSEMEPEPVEKKAGKSTAKVGYSPIDDAFDSGTFDHESFSGSAKVDAHGFPLDGHGLPIKAGALQNAIFNSANFSCIATDAKGVIQIFNVGAERMLGYSAEDVMNKITPADISDPLEVVARAANLSKELEAEIAPGFEALVFKALRGIEDIYELTYIRKDGSRFPAVVSVTALRDPQDAIIGFLLIGTDNTVRIQAEAEQKKLDQRLRDQQFYTRSLIESNIDALMTTDPHGIISDVNRQMEALTGCSRDELIGAPFKNYFTDPSRAEAGIKRVLAENKVTNYELTARTPEGKQTDVSYNATTFYDRDRVLQGVFAAARDITERKEIDRVLQENTIELIEAKSIAERANYAKSDFLSSMSHELRTPLNAILGFAQLIESDSPTIAQKRSLDQILQAGWYLLDLINEILDLALIESGKLALSMESLSLDTILRECETMIEPQARKRNIDITFIPPSMAFSVHADNTRLKQVLINLLSNAIKYNIENGRVTLQCKQSAPDRIRIIVQDTGCGLTQDNIKHLFQPFNRLGQEFKGKEGTGIGLVMTKRLVELMGGTIGVESIKDKGSQFWIELSVTESSEIQPAISIQNSASSFPPAFSPMFSPASASAPSKTDIHQDLSTDQRPATEIGAIVLGALEANSLEIVQTAQKHYSAPPKIKKGPRTYTLLYVEDDPANLMLIEDLIKRRHNIHLLTASNGMSGVNLARSAQPNVIIMDINLPGISGTEALHQLRRDPYTVRIPVVALSANAIPQDVENGLRAGFFRYLTKPIKVDEFMQTLDLALKYAQNEDMRPPAANQE
jgi:PAS domain S-box-containing protein